MKNMYYKILIAAVCLVSWSSYSQVALPQSTNKPQMMPLGDRTVRPPVSGRMPTGSNSSTNAENELRFNNATLDIVLTDYSEKTGRTLLIDPKTPKVNITLKSLGKMTLDDYLQAIETVLGMNGIALVKQGDRFLKVVPVTQARKESMEVRPLDKQIKETTKDELISQLIQLKHIQAMDVEKVIKPFLHDYGQVHILERTNSILITDAAANIARVLQVLAMIDQPVDALEEPHVVVIKFAKASDIKARLEEIIADQMKDQTKSTVPRTRDSGAPGYIAPSASPSLPGVIRPPRTPIPDSAAGVSSGASVEIVSEAEKGMIKGPVKIVADERTNILIILTRPENMKFFEKVIQVLDIETQPDITVKIMRLEYAMAETVAETLNTLIGGTTKEKDTTGKTGPGGTTQPGADSGRSSALQDYLSRIQGGGQAGGISKSKIGELSAANIKILPDKRTNALLIMASKGDLETIEEIIKSMDMMLSQVLVEAVLLQVSLDDNLQSGMHWIQKALIVEDRTSSGGLAPVGAIAGSGGGGRTEMMPGLAEPLALTTLGTWAEGGGLTAYFTHFGLNLDAIIRLTKSNTKSKIMATPVIVTTDNTKASLTSSEQQYFLKGSTVDQFGNVRPETEMKDIGLQLDVTPHINNKRNVMMDIVQTVSDVSGFQQVGDQGTWPITKKRSFTSSITVRDKETIILGGLVQNNVIDTKTGIPLLSSIPLLGKLFSYQKDQTTKSEMIAFITPYVLETPEEIQNEAKRRKESLSLKGLWEKGWSDSKIADKTREQVKAEEKEASIAEKAAKRAEKAAIEAEKERLKAIEIQKQIKQAQLKAGSSAQNSGSGARTVVPAGSVAPVPVSQENEASSGK